MSTLAKRLYAATIDRSKFREVFSRYAVFVIPLFYWGREPWWWGMAIVALGVFIRAWGAGCLQKDQKMAASGPYLLVRHPLYTGSCLLALGLVVVLHHWFVTIFVGGLTILVYWHTIQHEEKNLVARFGDSYRQRMRRAGPLWPTPRSIMDFIRAKGDRFAFSWRQYMKNREYECLLGVAALLAYLYVGQHYRF